MTFRVMTVYGTRPEAIKCAPVVKALEESPDFEGVTVVTGQHREMLDQVNELFGITPDHDLDVMSHGQSLSGIFARVLDGLDPLLVEERPDAVVVQGDTTSSTAAALAAFNRGIPVVHLEAGLRSGDLASPFPEEGNRRLTSQIATIHLAPTSTSRDNLLAEGVDAEAIVVTGNTVIDALLTTVALEVPFTDPRLEEVASGDRPVLLVTTHRRENWGEAMSGVGRAIARLARENDDLVVILPAHRNPVVRKAILPHLGGLRNVVVTEPLAYGEFARLMRRARVVLSDSGGVQEEAPSLGTPVLVMRDTTERPEAVAAGTVKLVGTDEDTIVREVSTLLHDEAAHAAMATAVNPFGDGTAAQRGLEALLGRLRAKQQPEAPDLPHPSRRQDGAAARVVVTGGAGYIGGHLVRLLAERGVDVAVVDDLSTGSAERVPDVPFLRLDLSEPSAAPSLARFLERFGATAVVHLAGRKRVDESVREPALYYQQNIGQLATTLSAMRSADVRDIVFSSSAAVYGAVDGDLVGEDHPTRPTSPYGASKLAWGQQHAWEAERGGIRAVSLRYFNVAGAGWDDLGDDARMNLVSIVLDTLDSGGRPVIYGDDYDTPDGTCIRDFIHVTDLCEAHLVALDRLVTGTLPKRSEFNVGTGRGTSVREAVTALTRLWGGPAVDPVLAARRAGDSASVVADPTSFRSATGWHAARDAGDIFASAIAAFPRTRQPA
jgi:UDP-N-acetylglucosamine 2-epimerase (non-hydrolysing)